MTLQSEPNAAISFLQMWSRNGPWWLTAIPLEGKLTTRTFHPGDVDSGELRNWLLGFEGRANIYFSVNEPRGSITKKAGKDEIERAIALHIDIDPRVGEDPAQERARILAELRAFKPAPTAIIQSGNGCQAFWKLHEPVHIGGNKEKYENFERYNLDLENKLGGDTCHNIDRIMRLPGTINVPNAAKLKKGRVAVLAKVEEFHPDRHYDLSEFELAAKPIASKAKGKAKSDAPRLIAEGTRKTLARRKVDLSALPSSVSDSVLRIIVDGHDPTAPNKYPSRSEAVFAVVCGLVRADVDDETIFSILLDRDFKVSDHIYDQGNPEASALRNIKNARAMLSTNWPGGRSRTGEVRKGYRNAIEAMRRLGLVGEFDEFRNRLRLSGHELQEYQGEMSDLGCAYLRKKITDTFDFDPGKDAVQEGAVALCVENTRDPVRDYLQGLKWDGEHRLDTWLPRYLRAEDTPLNREIGRMVLIAGVHRVVRPGCKFDYIMVLEGAQGAGKSSALVILAGGGDYFSDQPILDKNDQAQAETLEGIWIFELGELAGMKKADIDKVKGFASRTTDRVRPAYGRFRTDNKRRCIVVATTNETNYLRDPTGDRRFWPVRVGRVDLDALQRDRDQLWAEAFVAASAHKGALTIPEALWPAAAIEQAERKIPDDPWLSDLEAHLAHVGGDVVSARDLWPAVRVPVDRRTQHDNVRIGNCMRALGYKRTKLRFKRGRPPEWGYVRIGAPTGDFDEDMTEDPAQLESSAGDAAVPRDSLADLRAELGYDA